MVNGISTKIDIQYSDQKIIFGIAHCCSDKNYSFWKLDRPLVEELLGRLKHIEKMTWKEFGALPRDVGITPEIPGTESYDLIDCQNTIETKLIENYYFHFRTKQNGLFRVFGYQYKNIFYITQIDPHGKIHHS